MATPASRTMLSAATGKFCVLQQGRQPGPLTKQSVESKPWPRRQDVWCLNQAHSRQSCGGISAGDSSMPSLAHNVAPSLELQTLAVTRHKMLSNQLGTDRCC
ncbi:predicted protein [Histoplasma capsulatum G186AR]|uniref:Uncharacterized protein n=1 Tax=Ajellomyces capsulatus (strain G186AR / H82 / ATCC MYA-2454 / RMSCC 2432) TaxID=447093 RepID=C0NM59_AJECG|nr:uncharacterized protein HCBG_04589 [Histoplasma capsulatum G186AR]EEH07710.1 predicted protein [Histoplasma capsulatum G186AR]